MPVKRRRSSSSLSFVSDSSVSDCTPDNTPRTVILCVHHSKRATAAAGFVLDENKLLLFEDVEERRDSLDLLSLLIEQISPSVVLCSESVSQSVRESIKRGARDSSGVEILPRPAKQFNADSGKAGLKTLLFRNFRDFSGSSPAEAQHADFNDLEIGGVFNLQASCMMACLSCLITYLPRLLESREGEDDVKIVITGIERIRLDNHMLVNRNTLTALQILPAEGDRSYGSVMSLFNMLNRTKSSGGKACLYQWLLRPLTDLNEITRRQDAIACFMRDDNAHVVEELHNLLKSQNISTNLSRVITGKAKVKDWAAILSYIQNAQIVGSVVKGITGYRKVPVLVTNLDYVNRQDVQLVGATIDATLDWQESTATGTTVVAAGINAELDVYREQLDGLAPVLDAVAADIAHDFPPEIADQLAVCYFPQRGYFTSLPISPDEIDGLPGDWSHVFTTETFSYWKNDRMRELDNQIGDIAVYIREMQLEIVLVLAGELSKIARQFDLLVQALAELDCLLSLAMVSKIFDWKRPYLTEDSTLELREARHPLVEPLVEKFVPNDIDLTPSTSADDGLSSLSLDDKDVCRSIAVITGANGGGKSVFLKAVAINVILAQIGCFCPVGSAKLGIVDSIMTRVAAKESAVNASSAFMLDLHQVAYIDLSCRLRNCTEKSLLLIDEFGKGTEDVDGAALFGGLLEYLTSLGSNCPRTLACTHFQHIFTHKRVDLTKNIKLYHMPLGTSPDTSTECTYTLQPGLTTRSYAIECALQNGIPEPICRRAKHLSSRIAKCLPLVTPVDNFDEQYDIDLANAEHATQSLIEVDLDSLKDDADLVEMIQQMLG